MAATGTAPITVSLEGFGSAKGSASIEALLTAVLRAGGDISDLIFSPGRPPQVELHGQLVPVEIPRLAALSADDTRRIASELIGSNKQAIALLREQGSCDISVGIPGMARFRVNVFIQRGSCAIVMRVIPTAVPRLEDLGLPPAATAIVDLKRGIVVISGGPGSGKSHTMAAILDRINSSHTYHIITIEDPIEFLHNHKRSTIHQRELHSDTPSFAHALRATLRQAPHVIMVGDLRDRETLEMAMQAAETGHLILASLHAPDATKALDRLISFFPPSEQADIRLRLAKSLRTILCQRLLPRSDGQGRVAAFELLQLNHDARECVEQGGRNGRTLLEAIKAGQAEGMQPFDSHICQLIRRGIVDLEAGILNATHPAQLRDELGV
jgi:twitching motility protein PilT